MANKYMYIVMYSLSLKEKELIVKGTCCFMVKKDDDIIESVNTE